MRGRDATIGKRDFHARRAAGDMAVREEIAVRSDQETGTRARAGHAAAAAHTFDAQMSDRGRDKVDRAATDAE